MAAVDDILAGAVDMHVHSSPDILPRKQSDIAVARSARKAGLRGVLLKCHHGSTAARASLARECVGDIAVWGGIALNRTVGGLNPAAVEADLAMGGREIWFPTVSAVNHLRFFRQDLRAAVHITDDNGKLLPAAYEILELAAASGAIVGTGHLDVPDCLLLIAAAQSRRVRKILVTHPEWQATAMPMTVQLELAARGVMFERCFYATNSDQKLPVSEIARQIRTVGPNTTVLGSDFGQAFNEEPATGFRIFLQSLLAEGITARELEVMVKKNPGELL